MKTLTLSDRIRQLEEQKRALERAGVHIEFRRNNGTRRTPEKCALLQTLADEARQGRKPPFEASF